MKKEIELTDELLGNIKDDLREGYEVSLYLDENCELTLSEYNAGEDWDDEILKISSIYGDIGGGGFGDYAWEYAAEIEAEEEDFENLSSWEQEELIGINCEQLEKDEEFLDGYIDMIIESELDEHLKLKDGELLFNIENIINYIIKIISNNNFEKKTYEAMKEISQILEIYNEKKEEY